MNEPLIDEVVAAVAEHEPIVPRDLPEKLETVDLDVDQAENLLAIAADRERILKVNGRYWVMRVGEYADH